MIGRTGSYDGCQVIVLTDLDERMIGTARQDLAIDQGRELGENRRQEAADQVLDVGRNVGEVARATAQGC